MDVLAQLARGVWRKKGSEWKPALAGRWEPVYQLLLRMHRDQVRWMRKQIEELNRAIAEAMQEHMAALHRLSKIPGVDLYAAQELLSEIGPKAAALPSAEQFVSWVGVCPGSQESAGIYYNHRLRQGQPIPAAIALPDRLGGPPHQTDILRRSVCPTETAGGGKGAAWGVAHRVAKVIWLVLHQEVEYQEKGPAPPNVRTLVRKFNRMVKELGQLGLDVRALLDQQLANPA